MSHNEAALYHSNGYNAQAACEHCEGVIRHERWCQTLNPVVRYACKIVVLPTNWRSETRLSSTR
jgi:glycerol-3-phosphate cytidylyltransferase-like family protein